MKKFTSRNQKIGELGEYIACKFLMKRGFSIIERNYTKKWGEIDIVARKKGLFKQNNRDIRFIEVKTVTVLPEKFGAKSIEDVSYETLEETKRAEDNIHPWKIARLMRAIETYLLEKNVSDETEWRLDAIIVYLDVVNKLARIKVVEII